MKQDILFKGCTRPAMFMGVPYTPFFIASGACILLAVYINLFIVLLLPPIIFILRHIAKQDEMIFRLIGLRWRLLFRVRNRNLRDDSWVFTPNDYRVNIKSDAQRVRL